MTPKQRAGREARTKQCNDLLSVIGQHGRQFFAYQGAVSRLELDDRHRVWFVDSYSKRRVYTHDERGRWRGFTNGGTLRDLIRAMRDYIVKGAVKDLDRVKRALGPWPEWVCDGDLWGYGESMESVRKSAAVIFGDHSWPQRTGNEGER